MSNLCIVVLFALILDSRTKARITRWVLIPLPSYRVLVVLSLPGWFVQGIFYNIKNFLTFQLSTAVAALSIVAIATFMGFKCPINAMQVTRQLVAQEYLFVSSIYGAATANV